MGHVLFSEETSCGSILVSDHNIFAFCVRSREVTIQSIEVYYYVSLMSQLGFCYVNLHSGATEFISLLSDEVS